MCIAQAVDALGRSFLLHRHACDFYFKSSQLKPLEGQFVLWAAVPFPAFQDTHAAGNVSFLHQQFSKLSQTKKCCRLKLHASVWLYISISTLVFPSSDTHICNWICCVCSFRRI